MSAADDSLTLLFLCCHPALTPSSQVALTLRAVGGLSTAEIARALLVPESTVGQRITRAKQKIRETGARFTLPGAPWADEYHPVVNTNRRGGVPATSRWIAAGTAVRVGPRTVLLLRAGRS